MYNSLSSSNLHSLENLSSPLKNSEECTKFSCISGKPEPQTFSFLLEKLKSNDLFSQLSEEIISNLAGEFAYCREFDNQILFKSTEKITCFFILIKGCFEITNHSNSTAFMVSNGDCFGEESLFLKEYLTNFTVKVLDDCVFFVICKSTILNFFKKIIFAEYESNLITINLLFKNFSSENKEKMAEVSTKHMILTDELIKTNVEMDKSNLKEKEKHLLLNLFNGSILEIHLMKSLKKILSAKPFLSHLTPSALTQLISKIIIKSYQNEDIVGNCEENKVFILIQGDIEYKNNSREKLILKEGEIFDNLDCKQYVSNQNSIIGEIKMDIFKSLIKIQKDLIQNDVKTIAKKGISFNNLFYVKELGEGQFGRVILVKDQESGESFALKCISKRQKYFEEVKNYIEEERNALKFVDFPLIVKYKGSYEDEFYSYILMEYVKGHELFELIQTDSYFLANQCQFYAASLILILEYLHKNDIVYRDLKPENIMIDEKGYLKLVDLGSCKIVGKNSSVTSLCGTPHYMAPEMIKGSEYKCSIDLWSLGVVIFQLRCGFLPFGMNCDDDHAIYTDILRKDLVIPSDVEAPIKEFLEKVLKKDPQVREMVSFEDLKSLKWFDEFDWNDLKCKKIKAPYIPRPRNEKSLSCMNFAQLMQEENKKIRTTKSSNNLFFY